MTVFLSFTYCYVKMINKTGLNKRTVFFHICSLVVYFIVLLPYIYAKLNKL